MFRRYSAGSIQNIADLGGEVVQTEGLGDQMDSFIQAPVVDDGVPRVAGREQDLETGTYCAGLGADLGSRQAAGQDHVRKKQIHPQLPLQ